MRKIIAILMSVLLCLSVSPFPMMAYAEPGTEKGDINEDGSINGADLVRLRAYLDGKSGTINTDAADMNLDGAVNEDDFIALKKKVAGIGGIVLSSSQTEVQKDSEDYMVIFYADASEAMLMHTDMLYLYGSDGSQYEMFDNGYYSGNGDDLPNDNIYSCSVFVDTSAVSTTVYYASNGEIASNEVTVTVTEGFTDLDIEIMETVDEAIGAITETETFEAMSVEEKAEAAVAVLETLPDEVEQSSITVSDEMVTFNYANGIMGGLFLGSFGDETNAAEEIEEFPASVNEEETADPVTDSNHESETEFYDTGVETEGAETADLNDTEDTNSEMAPDVIEGERETEENEISSEEGSEPEDNDSPEEKQEENQQPGPEIENQTAMEDNQGETVEEPLEEPTDPEEESESASTEQFDCPWDGFTDEQFAAWVFSGENDAVIMEYLNEENQEANEAFKARVNQIELTELREKVELQCRIILRKEQQAQYEREKGEYVETAGLTPVYYEGIDYGKITIYYAFDDGNSDRFPYYLSWENEWEIKGLDTVINSNVTVDSLRNMSGNSIVVFAMHGTLYNGHPAFCLMEEATKEKNKLYANDLKNGRIAKVYSAGIYEYWILPEFFKQPGRGLDNTVVFSECCKAMGKEGNVDASMANALVSGAGATSVVAFHNSVYANYSRNILHYFVNRLLAGDTAEEALAAAKSKYGADDGHEVNAAYGILTGKRDARLINVGLQNDSFEKASYAAGWSTVGDVRIISKLGDLQPLDGSRMALLTTGIGSKEQAYLEGTEGSILSQKFIVPQNATTLTFRYDVISEEPMEFVNSQFDDKFLVEIRDQSGDSLDNRTVETINTSYWYQLDGAKYNFEGGDDTVYHTNWKTFSVDVSQWRGKLIELRFIVFDVGDSVYDTATLVDNVKVA